MHDVECLHGLLSRCGTVPRTRKAPAACAYGAPRQRIALGWQAKPVLEQTGASPLPPRVQLTHSSVHRAQFGGPV